MTAADVSPNEAGTPDELREIWQTDEILWFNDGRWGMCGYAMPNGQGKTWTNNTTIFKMHKLIGAMLFDLMHRVDVQFSSPPHKDWWWEWQKALVLLRTMVRAYRIDPGTTLDIDPRHVRNQRKTFLIFPIPFFGSRVRQEDCLDQAAWGLNLLGEIMQHSANEYIDRASGPFVDMVESYIRGAFLRAATKYFGFKPEDIRSNPDFVIPADAFGAAKYQPQNIIPSFEQSMERPALTWWPTENDLSRIRGIQYTSALKFAARWPVSYLEGEGDWESTLPGIENRVSEGDPIQIPLKKTAALGGKAPD
jgi:hypothetical protein